MRTTMNQPGVSSGGEDKRQAMDAVIAEFGPWNAYNIRIADDLYTMGSDAPPGVESRLAFTVQLVSDLSGGKLATLRVLDLACLEGVFGLEFARRGAQVVGIEGRQAHVERARFAADALDLENIEFHTDDVLNLSPERYGQFDVILCLGILYHLDEPDVFSFLRQLRETCRGFVVLDTHVSLAAKVQREYEGKSYSGRRIREHDPESTREDRERALRASLHNYDSFWLTRPSLVTALTEAGFTSVLDAPSPSAVTATTDRDFFVAFTGERSGLLTVGDGREAHFQRLPERDRRGPHRVQSRRRRLRELVQRALPRPLRRLVRRLSRPSSTASPAE